VELDGIIFVPEPYDHRSPIIGITLVLLANATGTPKFGHGHCSRCTNAVRYATTKPFGQYFEAGKVTGPWHYVVFIVKLLIESR
jgi:hypothetical protein